MDHFVITHLPEKISGLRELAYNLWWSWHPEGRALFKLHSRRGWYLSNYNPVKMINRMDKGSDLRGDPPQFRMKMRNRRQ
jgi:glycogen phosphorylase